MSGSNSSAKTKTKTKASKASDPSKVTSTTAIGVRGASASQAGGQTTSGHSVMMQHFLNEPKKEGPWSGQNMRTR
ncbi:hypothetical protein Tdes44962_MAKER04053 [Teratosphaeria destructans]|uniref:Uncharacterized protein n=1 Tax=Teratosphaeria destructans TaxID=418781 RepID=A0A9W7SNF3_9PEZI|nr:hypothetical protein Tdes44962_MAKER04053 [Teratosphaeria destructans]